MRTDLPLQKMAQEALDTFPPTSEDRGEDRGEDRDAASNYAQRMLTQHVSKMRKSGQSVLDADVQELRQVLNTWINTLEFTSAPDSLSSPDNTKQVKRDIEKPQHIERLETIISACFHTATDGSPKHLTHLRRRAMKEVDQYLGKADIGWSEKRRFKSKAKRLINKHLQGIK